MNKEKQIVDYFESFAENFDLKEKLNELIDINMCEFTEIIFEKR